MFIFYSCWKLKHYLKPICLMPRLNVPIQANVRHTSLLLAGAKIMHELLQAVPKGISVKFRLCQRAKAPVLEMTDCLEPAISVCSEDPKCNFVSELNPPAWGFAWLIRKSSSHTVFSSLPIFPIFSYYILFSVSLRWSSVGMSVKVKPASWGGTLRVSTPVLKLLMICCDIRLSACSLLLNGWRT